MNNYRLKEYCKDNGYVLENNLCLFQTGYLSQWYGGFTGPIKKGFLSRSES